MATEHLTALGLTDLEAQVYVHLLTETSATGYRIAQAIGKPTANTYKAIESLTRKGAVIINEDESRLCQAVPAREWLDQLDTRFQQNCKKARNALARLKTPRVDDRLYQLHTRDQVLARAKAMLRRAKHVAVMDIFPAFLDWLKEDLQKCAGKGVEVIVKTYRDEKIKSARVIVRPNGENITGALPGHMISLNIDGAEHLLALVAAESDHVHQAVWTSSTTIAFLLYNGLINEASQAAIMAELEGETTVNKIRKTFHSLRHLHPVSAKAAPYQNLIRKLGEQTEKVKTRTNGRPASATRKG